MKDVKHGRRIAGFKFDISKQSKGAAKTTPKQTVDKAQPTNTNIALAEQYKHIGVSNSEFEKLYKKHNQAYLKQLLIYAKYRATKQTIQSMFNYLCGVLNNKPQLEDLYTPNCLLKQKHEKQKLVEAHLQQTSDRQTQDKADEFKALSKKVEQYLSSCSESQLQEIKQEFSEQSFATGLTKL
jgi:hypothetical protein